MPDREKVIKALGCIAGQKSSCEECPYFVVVTSDLGGFSYGYCAKGNVAKDAIALLREQEPVEPDGENCGECGYTLHRINYDGPDKELRHEWFRFCPSCGRAVKWE